MQRFKLQVVCLTIFFKKVHFPTNYIFLWKYNPLLLQPKIFVPIKNYYINKINGKLEHELRNMKYLDVIMHFPHEYFIISTTVYSNSCFASTNVIHESLTFKKHLLVMCIDLAQFRL